MSRREESFLRKLRHPPEELPSYGHFKIVKTFKTNKIEAGHPATRNSAWLGGNTKGIHPNRSEVCSCKWCVATSGKENETNSSDGGWRDNCNVNSHVLPNDTQSSR
ncbi:hypothetical protein TNCV_3836611 [Trichonephila clavipes]|nr:hypothetical protein TNCV_3836611 [Trichonephila clavipes]